MWMSVNPKEWEVFQGFRGTKEDVDRWSTPVVHREGGYGRMDGSVVSGQHPSYSNTQLPSHPAAHLINRGMLILAEKSFRCSISFSGLYRP